MSITTAGEVTIAIQEQPFTLRGLINEAINVQYHKTPDDPEAISLGTVKTIATEIAKIFGVPPDGDKGFVTHLDKVLDELKGINNDLEKIVDKLLNTQIIITDIGINTNDPATYQFGFYIKFDQMKLGPVEIIGFGVLFTYTKDDGTGEVRGTLSAPGARGRLSTRGDF